MVQNTGFILIPIPNEVSGGLVSIKASYLMIYNIQQHNK